MSAPFDNSTGQGSVAAAVGGPSKSKRRPNKQKEQARSMFNPSAPPISGEKFFTEFIELKRNNVDLIFDGNVQDRLAEQYVVKARDYSRHSLHRPEDNADLPAATYALTSFTLIRKLLLAVPESESSEMGRFKDIHRIDFQGPKSVIAAVSNVGKFEYEDKVARLKYGSQDAFRLLMKTCKAMNQHSDFHEMYAAPPTEDGVAHGWDELDVNRLVISSESSVRWLRDESRRFLDLAYQTTWPVVYTPDGGQAIHMTCSYPRLPISDDPGLQSRNVAAWLLLLNEGMPEVRRVIAAGLMTCWRLRYFERLGSLWTNLGVHVPAWLGAYRPFDSLTQLQLYHCDLANDDPDLMSYVGFVHEIHNHLLNNTTLFARFLELAKQPNDKFGSAAQLIPYKPNMFVGRALLGLDGFDVQRLKSDATSVCVTKVKDRGLVTAGLAFGFVSDVQVVDNYLGRLNGNADEVRRIYLRPDIKNL